MKLEDQVTSLELSKRLKELGVKQESLFWWTNCNIWNKYEEVELTYAKKWDDLFLTYKNDLPDVEDFESEYSEMDESEKEQYSAFTVAELGEMLPWRVGYSLQAIITRKERSTDRKGDYWVSYLMEKDKCNDYFDTIGFNHIKFDAWTEADARAKLLIYLLENNLVSHPKKEVEKR